MSQPALPARTDWRRAIANQMNVLGALVMRELHTRYGRENVGYLWMILEPMSLAVAVALIHSAHPQTIASDIQAVPFSTLGYCVFIMFRGIFTRSEGAIESNMPLLYHRMVTIFDIMLSRAILEAAGTTATLFVLLFFGISFGLCDWPARPLYLLLAVFMMAWFSFGAGLLCVAITHDNRPTTRLVHPFSYILMPLSGGFWMMSWIPEPIRSKVEWFPMPSIFETARYGQFRAAPDDYLNIQYVLTCCMALTLLGLLSIRITRRHIHLR